MVKMNSSNIITPIILIEINKEINKILDLLEAKKKLPLNKVKK